VLLCPTPSASSSVIFYFCIIIYKIINNGERDEIELSKAHLIRKLSLLQDLFVEVCMASQMYINLIDFDIGYEQKFMAEVCPKIYKFNFSRTSLLKI